MCHFSHVPDDLNYSDLPICRSIISSTETDRVRGASTGCAPRDDSHLVEPASEDNLRDD